MEAPVAKAAQLDKFEWGAGNVADDLPSSSAPGDTSPQEGTTAIAGEGPTDHQPKDEDPLIVAQREQEERERALAEAADIRPDDDPTLKASSFKFAFYSDMKEVDRENEVNRILGAFKLNPFEALGLRFDATIENIRRQYRKVSLAVHPDKCSHPRAKDAFELIGNAQKELLNEEKRTSLDFLLNTAKEEVLKEWRKLAKKDAAVALASVLAEEGKRGIQGAWERSEEFHEAWKAKGRDILAKAEWRRRKMTKRLKEEEERAKEEHVKDKQEAKRKREEEKDWESGREARVGSWRTFVSGVPRDGKKSTKPNKGTSFGVGGLKPPKSKTADEDKTYVQRPVGEQHRPPVR